jgi:hypothetical protein
MRDYCLTITDQDGDTIELTHDTDSPENLMIEARRIVMGEVRSVSVSLSKKDARSVLRFLDVFINEEDECDDF